MEVMKKIDIKFKKYDNINFISNNKKYKVISIEYDYYRIFNDLGEPSLYPAYFFDILDNSIESNWVIDKDKKDIVFFGPKELSGKYFFEDFFDGDKTTNSILLEYITKII